MFSNFEQALAEIPEKQLNLNYDRKKCVKKYLVACTVSADRYNIVLHKCLYKHPPPPPPHTHTPFTFCCLLVLQLIYSCPSFSAFLTQVLSPTGRWFRGDVWPGQHHERRYPQLLPKRVLVQAGLLFAFFLLLSVQVSKVSAWLSAFLSVCLSIHS